MPDRRLTGRLGRVARDPRRAVRYAEERVAGVRRTVDAEQREVALTFDDGPDARYTPGLLDLLAELDVPATFFLVGSAASAQRPLVARLAGGGHAIGIHTSQHANLTRLSFRAVREELHRSRSQLEQLLGEPVRLFRAPYAAMNLRTAAAARLAALDVWLWSVDPEDWRPLVPAEEIAARSRVEPGDVVLLHDGSHDPIAEAARDRSTTVAAVRQIVEHAREDGLAFVSLPHREDP